MSKVRRKPKASSSPEEPAEPRRSSNRTRAAHKREGLDSDDEPDVNHEDDGDEDDDNMDENFSEKRPKAVRKASKDQMKAIQRRKKQRSGSLEEAESKGKEVDEQQQQQVAPMEVADDVEEEMANAGKLALSEAQEEYVGLSTEELSDSEVEVKTQKQILEENEKELEEWHKAQPDQCCICLFDTDEMGPLVLCDGPGCEICVHQECYGILNIPEKWFCDRCADKTVASCVLCPEKTGALKRTVDGNYVHVVCALWMDGTTFVNEAEVGPVSVEGIPARYWNLKCSICKDDRDASYGACAPCDAGRCKNNVHITCAQKWSLLEDQSTEEEDMANPYFIFCKSHGPVQPPKMEEWYRWIKKKPTIKPSNPNREEGWLADLPLNYHLFVQERAEEVSRLRGGLVALHHQTNHVKKNIVTMREAKKKCEEQIPLLKESKKKMEQELEELKASLTTIYNAAHSHPLDQPLAQNMKIIEQFRAARVPTPKPATLKPSTKASPSPVRRGKPLLPARVIYPRMSTDFPEIPTNTPTLQPLTMIKRTPGRAVATKPTRPLSTSNVCRMCSNADYQREGRGDPATAPYLLECATCGGKFHMGCLEPPMEKKPRVGYVWSCVDCESGTSSIEEEEPDLDAAVARTRSKTASLPPTKKTFDEQLEEIETREIEEKFKQRERSSRREKGSSPRLRPESPSVSNKRTRLSQEEDSK